MSVPRLSDAVLVVTDGRGRVLGSCFRAPVLDSSRAGTFLLAAAHGLLTEARRGDQVVVVEHTGARHRADVLICPTQGEDVSLLYVPRPLGPPVRCVSPPPKGAVVIRGALSGLDTAIGTLRGWYSGLESLGEQQMMDVVIRDFGLLEPPGAGQPVRSLAYAGLRGMSGAPVGQADTAEALVYGMVVRRNTAGIANHVYALSVDAIRRFLGEWNFSLRTTRRVGGTAQPANLLFGRLMTRLLDSPGGLHRLWEDASGLFYSGVPVDATFLAAIRHPEQFGLDTLRVAEVRFLLARLLLKRGDEQRGLAMLREARAQVGRSSAVDHRHLAALIDLRTLLHAARDINPAKRRSVFEYGIGTYEQTPGTTDDERAYEVASAVGSEASQLATDMRFVRGDARARRQFSTLLAKHTGLVAEFPGLLRDKQEVVNLALSATDIMWETDDRVERAERLAELGARGRLAAIQRGNGIFYAQMLLADAIAARLNDQPHRAFALICMVGTVLSSSDLRLSHEGVRACLSYLDEHDDVAAQLLRLAHSLDLPDARARMLDSGLPTKADEIALDAAFAWCRSLDADARGIGDIFDLEGVLGDL